MEDRTEAKRAASLSGWGWLIIGVLAVSMIRSSLERAPVPARTAVEGLEQNPIDLSTATVRELRRLPGIGNRRAVQVTRARWEHDPSNGALRLGDLPGIGPVTEERVGRSLEPPRRPVRRTRPVLELVSPSPLTTPEEMRRSRAWPRVEPANPRLP